MLEREVSKEELTALAELYGRNGAASSVGELLEAVSQMDRHRVRTGDERTGIGCWHCSEEHHTAFAPSLPRASQRPSKPYKCGTWPFQASAARLFSPPVHC